MITAISAGSCAYLWFLWLQARNPSGRTCYPGSLLNPPALKAIYLRQSSPILHVVLKVLKRPMPATSHNWWLIGEPSKMTWTKVRIVPNCTNKWCEVQISTSGWRTYEPSKMARLAWLRTWMTTGLHVLLSTTLQGAAWENLLYPLGTPYWIDNWFFSQHADHMDFRQRLWDFTLCMYIIVYT